MEIPSKTPARLRSGSIQLRVVPEATKCNFMKQSYMETNEIVRAFMPFTDASYNLFEAWHSQVRLETGQKCELSMTL